MVKFTTILSNSIKKNTNIQSYNSLDFEIIRMNIQFCLIMSKNDNEADVGSWVD